MADDTGRFSFLGFSFHLHFFTKIRVLQPIDALDTRRGAAANARVLDRVGLII